MTSIEGTSVLHKASGETNKRITHPRPAWVSSGPQPTRWSGLYWVVLGDLPVGSFRRRQKPAYRSRSFDDEVLLSIVLRASSERVLWDPLPLPLPVGAWRCRLAPLRLFRMKSDISSGVSGRVTSPLKPFDISGEPETAKSKNRK